VNLTSKGAVAAVLIGGSTFNNQAASLRFKKFNEKSKSDIYNYMGAVRALYKEDPILKEAMKFFLEGRSSKEWARRRSEIIALILERASCCRLMIL
jgi:hypothetical protein